MAATLVTGCAGDDFDRASAVQRQAATHGLGPDAAACYVDRVVDEVGEDPLGPEAPPPDEATAATLAAIRLDCAGIDEVGRTGDPFPAAEAVPGDGPVTFGDDEALDALWVGCEQGDGATCDRLFEEAPLGSDYERFGATCGGRGAEPLCGEVYPG